jgi:hypothetical protein
MEKERVTVAATKSKEACNLRQTPTSWLTKDSITIIRARKHQVLVL